jgi:hypothetical protein
MAWWVQERCKRPAGKRETGGQEQGTGGHERGAEREGPVVRVAFVSSCFHSMSLTQVT